MYVSQWALKYIWKVNLHRKTALSSSYYLQCLINNVHIWT